MSRGPDAATLLERRLRWCADAADIALSIVRSDWTRWASATFTGARHLITVSLYGPDIDGWLAALPEADLPLRDHLVADAVVVACRRFDGRVEADLELLTVEDR